MKEYRTIHEVSGPLMVVEQVEGDEDGCASGLAVQALFRIESNIGKSVIFHKLRSKLRIFQQCVDIDEIVKNCSRD